MSAHDPLHLANAAQNMARGAEGANAKVFQGVAIVSMCVMAAATAAGLARDIMRDLKHKDDRQNNRHRGR